MKKYYQIDNVWICAECSREFNSRQATTSHIHRAHTKPGVSYGGHKLGTPTWNKGLTKEDNPILLETANRISCTLKEGYASGRIIPTKNSIESRRATSNRMSLHNPGGKSKWYEVAGQKCQGTWERNVALKLEELDITWVKLKTHKDILEYEMDGTIRSYTPDFYLPTYNVYLEVKGYWWGRDREKMDIVIKTYPDKKIVILEKEQYEKFLGGELVW
jgi:hypothetical protein